MSGVPSETSSLPPEDLIPGLRLAVLVFTWPEWRKRRMISLELPDVQTQVRHTRIDFKVPPKAREGIAEDSPAQLPVSFLRKQTYFNFEVTDAQGREVSPLTANETQLHTIAILEAVGKQVLGLGSTADLKSTLREKIRIVTSRDQLESEAAAEALINEIDMERHNVHSAVVNADTDNIYFRFVNLTRLFSECYLLMIESDAKVGDRCLLSYSYDEDGAKNVDPKKSPNRRQRLKRSLAINEIPIEASVGFCNRVGSIHFELEAPAELQISGATMTGDRGRGTTRISKSKARFYVSSPGDDVERVELEIKVRPRPSLIVRAATLVAAAITVFLGLGAWRMGEFQIAAGGAASIIAAIPALFTTIVTGTGESRFTNANVFGLRCVAALPGLFSLAGGTILLASFGEFTNRILWIVLAVLSATISALLVFIWTRIRHVPNGGV